MTKSESPTVSPTGAASGSALAFFRQSGWMVAATTLMGVFMILVHTFGVLMPKAEYGVFTTLLQIVNLMGIPAIGLQTVFAQQTAAAITEPQLRQLTGTLRAVLLWTFLIWFTMAASVVLLSRDILSTLHIANPAGLWLTLLVGLMQLWLPILMGVLQGRQDFLWLGTTSILNGAGRFIAVSVLVANLGGFAAGAMTGVFLGMFGAFCVSALQVRTILFGPRDPFDWRPWVRRVVPLTLGLGAAMFMLSADMIIVQSFFDEQTTGLYAAAGMIGRGLVFFTIPLTAVMFPKIVQSAARSEKSDVLALALGATALLGGCTALFCTLFPKLPLLILYPDKSFLAISYLVPWFAWCMLPLTMSNVLVNNLLARGRFEVVPWLLVVAAGYGTALVVFADSFISVVRTLGVASLVLFGVAAWFTWRRKPK